MADDAAVARRISTGELTGLNTLNPYLQGLYEPVAAETTALELPVIGLMRVIALEGASKGVHANAVAPYALTGMTEKYVDDATGAAMPAELVAPVVSWLVSEGCRLNGETLVAGAGRVRPAWRVEGPGLDFGRETDIPLERFDAARETLMSAENWTRPYDGNAAFVEFLAATPPRA